MESKMTFKEKWDAFWHKDELKAEQGENPFLVVCRWAYKLRSVLLAIPVVFAAIVLALQNIAKLPAKVGLDLQVTGEYALVVSKALAVAGPLAITGVCLVLMFLSRRVLTPWLVSVFSLVLPIVILVINTFPG